MLKSERARWAIVLCLALLTASCGDDITPTAPTPGTEPASVTLDGTWSGMVDGSFIDGGAIANITQEGTNVSGAWSMPMPAALVALDYPADVTLAGPVTGTVTGMTAELSFGFDPSFAPFLGSADCAISVSVTSFNETTLEAGWRTNESCQPPIMDEGTLTFMRQ
jgi:hypothetical protein